MVCIMCISYYQLYVNVNNNHIYTKTCSYEYRIPRYEMQLIGMFFQLWSLKKWSKCTSWVTISLYYDTLSTCFVYSLYMQSYRSIILLYPMHCSCLKFICYQMDALSFFSTPILPSRFLLPATRESITSCTKWCTISWYMNVINC